MKVLHLTLSKKPFEVMITGEKTKEFRKNSDWIISRLMDKESEPKHYDVIKFVNGYGSDKPFFTCKYDGFMQCYMDLEPHNYSNGLEVNDIVKYDFIIFCGEIISKGNVT